MRKTGAKIVFAAAAVAAAPLFAAALPSEDAAPSATAEQRVLTVVESPLEYDLNPHTASYSNEAQLFTGLYEGLFSYDPGTLEPVNAICASYKVSRDKRRWTFTLRPDAAFSDGSPITAQTIRDSWLRLLATPGAPFASLIDCIAGAEAYRSGRGTADSVRITARDSQTLVVHLTEPTEHLARILCHHAFAAVSATPGVYSGPFVLASYAADKIELVKNEKYRDAASVRLPGITILLSNDEKENAYLFNTGRADWVASGSITADAVLERNAVRLGAEFGTTYLFFKAGGREPWNMAEFRQALVEAVPYDQLRKNYAAPATTLIYPLPGYPAVAGLNDYDAEDALALMDAARKKAGIPKDKALPLTFAINDSDYMRAWAELLQKAWEPLGVELQVQEVPSARYNAAIPAWDADLFSYSWLGDFADPLAFLELFRGNSTLNVAQYASAEFDGLLLQASRTGNSSARYRLLSQAEQVLLDDGVIIPISHSISLHIIDTAVVGGWAMNALDIHPFKYLYFKRQEASFPNIVMAK